MSAALPISCRSCGAHCDGAPAPMLCPSCGAVLPVHPRTTPFALLGMARPRFAVAPSDLERAWLDRSRRVHPDRFAGKSEAERRCAAEQIAALNDAKRAIFEPFDRALWLVSSAGVASARLDQALLAEMMELREGVEAEPASRERVVAEVSARVRARLTELTTTLAPLDLADDGYATPSPALRRAAALLAEMKTLARLVADLGGGKLIGALDDR